jgi:hypothetical protein
MGHKPGQSVPGLKVEASDHVAASAPIGAAGTCACGTRNDPDARFCKACGAKLVAA